MNVPDNATEGRFYALEVKRHSAEIPTGTELEIYLGGTSEFIPFIHVNGSYTASAIANSTSSITEPADAESVLAVGAVDYTRWMYIARTEEFSSRGPTNDWNGSNSRIKPDIMGPDGVTTYTYGDSSFFGTSAATSHVTGVAALFLSMNPDMIPDELQEILEKNAIPYGGTEVPNNTSGWGKVNADNNFPIVKSYQKISETEGNFSGIFYPYNIFWESVASIGDLNGDGIVDLAVGAFNDDDGGSGKGAVWILFLDYFPFDYDNDGMIDNWEIQYGLNPDTDDSSEDPDGDDYSNINEFMTGTYPNDSDSDDDGMPDGWEVEYGLDPLVDDADGDADGDSYNNLKEYLNETSPNNAESHPPRAMSWLPLLLGDE